MGQYRRRPGGRGRGPLSRIGAQFRRRPKPLWIVILSHVLALGVALVLYALPHHVIPRAGRTIGVTSTRGGVRQTAQAEARATAEVTGAVDAEVTGAVDAEDASSVDADAVPAVEISEPEATPEPEADVGNFRDNFPGVFTDGAVEKTDTSYRSENLNVVFTSGYISELRAQAYVADIYVADISCIQTVFAQDTYGRGFTEWAPDIAFRKESVVTLNGDYYGTRDSGVVIRNGELYRDNKLTQDVAILYWDGHFETFSPADFDAMTEMANGAYQSWCFGPMLIDENGAAMTEFNCNDQVAKKHPRSAIGYYEPGHYCFVAVDGRNGKSHGASMKQLSQLMANLGCTKAYNLDGGQTSLLCAGDQLVNDPSDGGRNTSDVIIVVDRVTE